MQATAMVEVSRRERQEGPLASNARLPIRVQTGGLGPFYCALSFMTECRIRGDQVMRILDLMRVKYDSPGIDVRSGYKYIFDMHETISTHQEMIHKATVFYLQPKRHISYHDIRDYDYEKIKAHTADFLLATSLDKLRSGQTRLRQRLEQLQSINTNILTQTASTKCRKHIHSFRELLSTPQASALYQSKTGKSLKKTPKPRNLRCFG